MLLKKLKKLTSYWVLLCDLIQNISEMSFRIRITQTVYGIQKEKQILKNWNEYRREPKS